MTPTTTPLQTILTCRLVSLSWCRLASDNEVWRALFCGRWGVDLRRGGGCGYENVEFSTMMMSRKGRDNGVPGMQLGKSWFGLRGHEDREDVTALVDDDDASESDSGSDSNRHLNPKLKPKSKLKSRTYQTRSTGSGSKQPNSNTKPLPVPVPVPPVSVPVPLSTSPLLLDWRVLYRERIELERRWEGGKACVALSEFRGAGADASGGGYGESKDKELEVKMERYEPRPMRITGHSDR